MRVWVLPLSIAAAVFIYWKWARPALSQREELKEFYANCDSIWQAIWLRAKKSWLMISATALIILPELPGYLTQFGMLDLSVILPPEWAFWASKMLGFAGMLLRIVMGPSLPIAPPPVDDTVR
jgi:hypothetical protein